MEVQRGADAITTRGLVLLVWWFMPLRGKVPRDSWCGFMRIKWEAPAAVVRDGSGCNIDMLATAGGCALRPGVSAYEQASLPVI